MICGVVTPTNLTSDDKELISFMLSNSEKQLTKMPESEVRTHLEKLHKNLRENLS